MLLFAINTTAIILQTTITEPTTNMFKEYGIPGLLILLMLGMFKYFMNDADKKSEKREDVILRHNEMREKSLESALSSLEKLVERVGQDWRETNYKLDRNYQDAINKFVAVIKDQGEQNNYSVQVLTELKEKIEELSKRNNITKSDYDEFRTQLTNIFNKIGLEYNLSRKQ